MDAFSENWGGKNGLFVPPISIITRVIRKMRVDAAKGVLVLPCWRSASFWPLVCEKSFFIDPVKHWIDLPTQKEFYVKCRSGKGIFGNEDLQFRMLVMFLDFSLQ